MRYRCTVLAFALLMSLPAFAGYEEGLKAYKSRDSAQSLREFRPLAEQGDARAQYYLGYFYQIGFGVARDATLAVHWYTKSAEQGYAIAQWGLAWMYEVGEGVARDEAKAAEWYTKAAEQGNNGAQTSLGLMYRSGRGVAQDKAKAVYWFTKAAERGDISAKSILNEMAMKYRQDFQQIKTAGDARKFSSEWTYFDPDGLVSKAREMEQTFAQAEEDTRARAESARVAEAEHQRLEDEKRRKAELIARAEADKARAQEHKMLVAWRSRIRVESKTNCGPVIEIKGNLIKVYAPVANYSSEHWLERDTLFPPGYDCTWFNGNYRAPSTD